MLLLFILKNLDLLSLKIRNYKNMKKILNFFARKFELYSYYGFFLSFYLLKRKLSSKGINIARYKLYDKKWLHNLEISTVIDIGANIGEFTSIFNELFPSSVIYAFEPIPECFSKLSKRVGKFKNIKIYNVGLGSQNGELKLNKSSHDPASSFRDMADLHKKNYPHSSNSVELNVPIVRLDDFLESTSLDNNIFIKIDVQGFEDEVIKGGIKTFDRAKVIIIESSFQKLYENEPLFHGIYSLLQPLGFEFMGCLKQSEFNLDESFLQGDCIFIKSK